MPSTESTKKGQIIYTPFLLKIYNFWVLDISNKWIWRCSKQIQQKKFNQYVSAKHLDIGVGTGYYLKKCKSPARADICLMDMNPHCLSIAKKNIGKLVTNTYLADIYKPQTQLSKKFTSISMNYLLHCLPGSMEEKEEAIKNAISMLTHGGIFFGATILTDENLHTKISRDLCNFYNKKGIFSNQNDRLQSLRVLLGKHLNNIEISLVGCVAVFKGVKI